MAGEPTVTNPAADNGIHERLSLEQIDSGDLLASTHVHRYELAARLCRGARVLDLCCGTGYGTLIISEAATSVHGVDVAPDAIETAREHARDAGHVGFEVADALAHVRAAATDAYDAIVCFEGIEHVPDPEALLAELERHAATGVRVLLSFPNSRGFEERNEFHVTDYGWEEVQRIAERFPGAVLLGQYLTEGSLIRDVRQAIPDDASARVIEDGDDGTWANHWLLVANPEADASASTLRFSLASRPTDNGYMRALEQANAELYRTNNRLARAHLGVHDAAAAVMVRRVEEALARAAAAEAETERWHQIADNNDWARRDLELRLTARRYAAVDAVRDRVLRVPGARLLVKLARRD